MRLLAECVEELVRDIGEFGVEVPLDARASPKPVRFVFEVPDLPVAGLPRRTSVERALADPLRAGRHWHIGHGWFPL
ncbi:hypothetical protein CEB94_10740 [Streptomyces hawaiiensis]|uniref:GNAT-like C-terminal domain-containing protein n=1 Tax=Streptomyces hawaiiensis TaxID=67305 RepID=A0A6G5RB12_9ACTN|nr:hypothetical protein CEB94_10740 [Streptomyces hawaiiensis]